MMPLPQLLDGLGRSRVEVVQKAFNLHYKAFRSEFLRNLSEGASSLTEEHVTRMAVLFETLVNHFQKTDKNPSFVSSVRNLTIDHLIKLIQELEATRVVANSASMQQKKAILELLHFHLNYFRNWKEPTSVVPDAVPSQGKFVTLAHVHSSAASNVLLHNLTSRTDEDIVRYALLSSDAVACAQQVLLARGGRSMSEVTEFFQSVADAYVNDLLEKRQIDIAKDVLHNTDRDVWPTLKALCLNTQNSNIRDYLALELNAISLLEPIEIDVWKFLILIESITKDVDLTVFISDESLKIKKAAPPDNQFKLSISLLLTLPRTARTSLLIELYFETMNGTLEPMLVKEECWSYLLCNNSLEVLIKWISASYCGESKVEKSDRLSAYLSSCSVTQEMIDFIPVSKCSSVTKECLLDFLSKFGLYTTEESSNVHKRLSRAIHTGQIFDQWNEETEKLFVEFCVQCNMPELLVSCTTKTNLQSPGWLRLYNEFQTLKVNTNAKSALKDCIELSAKFLNLTVEDNPFLSLASFLLSDQTLREILDGISGSVADDYKEQGQLLQKTLSHFPPLLAHLTNDKEHETPDISLQFLLNQKYACGSSHRILKQESLCSMFKDNPDDEGVHFSHEPTMLLHGHSETLDFQYYLKQGRPCHASMLVLADVIRNHGKPSRKLLKRAIFTAHKLAFLHIVDSTVVSSCIAFIEMLGERSLTLRTHIATVKQILSFSAEQSCEEMPKMMCDENLFYQFMLEIGAGNAHTVFERLLCCLPLDISLQGLAVQFALLHKLPLPKEYLVHCAQKNDWMSFLLFCQVYSYPLDVVRNIAKQFQSENLREHFESFLYRYFSPARKVSRAELSRHKRASQTSASDSLGSKESEPSPTTAPSLSKDTVSAPLVSCSTDSLFGVLLACHNCADPAEALLHLCVEMPSPVLAVLAEFYQANTEAQLVAWLASWLPQEERVYFECWQKNVPWPPEVVESVILKSLEISCSNLLTGLKIFLPDHPLVLVFEVLKEFPHQEFSESVKALQRFQTLCSTLGTTGGSWCLSNSSFVSDIFSKILLKFIQCLSSTSERREFLKILCESSVTFTLEGTTSLDFSKMLEVLDVLASTQVTINVANFIQNRDKEIGLCVEKLLSQGMFKEASDLSGNTFVIEEQTVNFKKWLKSSYQDFSAFCSDVNVSFEQAVVDPSKTSEYFLMCAADLKNTVDRWKALLYAVRWQERSASGEKPLLMNKTEIDLWKCCVYEKDTKIYTALAEDLQHSPLSCLCSTQLANTTFTGTKGFHDCDRSCEDQPCASRLINCLLDIGDIVSASRVRNHFQFHHRDFDILLSCIQLAEESVKMQELQLKVENVDSFHFLSSKDEEQRFSRFSPDCSEILSLEKLQVLTAIQKLSKQLKHGKDIGKQVLACYNLAIHLGLSYTEVIAVSDPLKLLRTAISQTYSGGYSFVSDIMTAFRLSPTERAKIISREIIAAISKGPAAGNVKVFLLWGHDIQQHFSQLLCLISDPSLLGNELMNMINKLTNSDKNTPKPVLVTTVELLVRAHDCYAAGCNMEGISQVLRSVVSFTPILKACSEWALMVRLLTGIQRYTEMNYIFKILKENEQFEFLLRKDSVKPLGFKLALLDWLRRECSHDKALLKMTAAHFQMHQQEAELWEKEGSDRLSDLVEQGLLNNQKTKGCLQTVMQDFSHAAECYLQADLLNHAMKSAHQAELVALQLHLLASCSEGSILRVIMLDSKSISKVVTSTLSFYEALIVARAYNHRTDWAAALFYHCISPGLSAEEYFSAWSSCMELTPAIAQNLAYRLQRASGVTRDMTSNMQWLLGHVKDMDVRYRIASELGLKDMVESLLQAPEVAYLKDTVWQDGFKR